MNGPEHFVEAERLTDAFKEAWSDVEAMPLNTADDRDRRLFASDGARLLLSKASIHANLALAAAQAERVISHLPDERYQQWVAAVSGRPLPESRGWTS